MTFGISPRPATTTVPPPAAVQEVIATSSVEEIRTGAAGCRYRASRRPRTDPGPILDGNVRTRAVTSGYAGRDAGRTWSVGSDGRGSCSVRSGLCVPRDEPAGAGDVPRNGETRGPRLRHRRRTDTRGRSTGVIRAAVAFVDVTGFERGEIVLGGPGDRLVRGTDAARGLRRNVSFNPAGCAAAPRHQRGILRRLPTPRWETTMWG